MTALEFMFLLMRSLTQTAIYRALSVSPGGIAGDRAVLFISKIWSLGETDGKLSMYSRSAGDTSDEETKLSREVEGGQGGVLLHVHIADQRDFLHQGDIQITRKAVPLIEIGKRVGSRKPGIFSDRFI